jgi:uncharacterized membrane protein YidH (DUF202 family)
LASQDRDLVLAVFATMTGLSGVLLALMGFVIVRYDALKADDYTAAEQLRPYRQMLVGIVGLMSCAAVVACLALLWLLGIASFAFPVWIVVLVVLAVPVLGAAALKLRW